MRDEIRSSLRYFGIFLLLIGGSIGYGFWRESTLEPLTKRVDLASPQNYSFFVWGFYPTEYFPTFRIEVPSPTTRQWWSEPDQLLSLWKGNPPQIFLSVRDSSGREVLSELGALLEANEWIVTGSGGGDVVFEVYKFDKFKGRLFSRYKVDFRVLDPSPAARTMSIDFCLTAIKAYALLPNVLFTMLLILLMVLGMPILFGLQTRRRWRRMRAG